jgi:ATP-dependent Clp protease ATP-binding subunit ClpA
MEMPTGQRLSRLAAEAAGAPTPGAALRLLGDLRAELEAFERRQVALALAEGATFAAIARDLGLSRQAVHRRFRELAAEAPPLATSPDARRVLRYAREEAAALGSEEVAAEHLIPGILRAAELPAAAALRALGVTLERARAQIEAASPRRRLFHREPRPADLRALLAGPARSARARGSRRIEVDDLLLGTLDADGGAARTLRALGAHSAALREALGRPARA